MTEKNDELLDEVKSFLDFTWEDPAREKRIQSYINSSKQYLNDIAGEKIDYDVDLLARDLLFNRVLYMDSKALNDFNENYAGMIQEMRINYVVKQEKSETVL